jgi:heptosyltransferase-2
LSGGRIVRAPNHLGDLVMSLPALHQADAAAIVVPRGLAPLLAMAELDAAAIPLDRGTRGLIRAAARVRQGAFSRGILLTPSFSSALLFRLGAVSELRGTATDARDTLLHDVVPMDRLRGLHRTIVYTILVTGVAPARPLTPVVRVAPALAESWRALAGEPGSRMIGIFPGSNAPSRRWDADRFAALASSLAVAGYRVVIFGGPGETALTRAVAGSSAFDAGGRTDLPLLAAGLAACHILVTNDSGPLHLAAAVGTRTVSLWGAGNPLATGVSGAGHTMLRRPDLPCVPCVKNTCPRHGAGTFLPNAERECLRLIEVSDVLNAVQQMTAA